MTRTSILSEAIKAERHETLLSVLDAASLGLVIDPGSTLFGRVLYAEKRGKDPAVTCCTFYLTMLRFFALIIVASEGMNKAGKVNRSQRPVTYQDRRDGILLTRGSRDLSFLRADQAMTKASKAGQLDGHTFDSFGTECSSDAGVFFACEVLRSMGSEFVDQSFLQAHSRAKKLFDGTSYSLPSGDPLSPQAIIDRAVALAKGDVEPDLSQVREHVEAEGIQGGSVGEMAEAGQVPKRVCALMPDADFVASGLPICIEKVTQVSKDVLQITWYETAAVMRRAGENVRKSIAKRRDTAKKAVRSDRSLETSKQKAFEAILRSEDDGCSDGYEAAAMAGEAACGDFRGHRALPHGSTLSSTQRLGPQTLARYFWLNREGDVSTLWRFLASISVTDRWPDQDSLARAFLQHTSSISVPSSPAQEARDLQNGKSSQESLYGCFLYSAPAAKTVRRFVIQAYLDELGLPASTAPDEFDKPEIVHRLYILLKVIPPTGCRMATQASAQPTALFGEQLARPAWMSELGQDEQRAIGLMQSDEECRELLKSASTEDPVMVVASEFSDVDDLADEHEEDEADEDDDDAEGIVQSSAAYDNAHKVQLDARRQRLEQRRRALDRLNALFREFGEKNTLGLGQRWLTLDAHALPDYVGLHEAEEIAARLEQPERAGEILKEVHGHVSVLLSYVFSLFKRGKLNSPLLAFALSLG